MDGRIEILWEGKRVNCIELPKENKRREMQEKEKEGEEFLSLITIVKLKNINKTKNLFPLKIIHGGRDGKKQCDIFY